MSGRGPCIPATFPPARKEQALLTSAIGLYHILKSSFCPVPGTVFDVVGREMNKTVPVFGDISNDGEM